MYVAYIYNYIYRVCTATQNGVIFPAISLKTNERHEAQYRFKDSDLYTSWYAYRSENINLHVCHFDAFVFIDFQIF